MAKTQRYRHATLICFDQNNPPAILKPQVALLTRFPLAGSPQTHRNFPKKFQITLPITDTVINQFSRPVLEAPVLASQWADPEYLRRPSEIKTSRFHPLHRQTGSIPVRPGGAALTDETCRRRAWSPDTGIGIQTGQCISRGHSWRFQRLFPGSLDLYHHRRGTRKRATASAFLQALRLFRHPDRTGNP